MRFARIPSSFEDADGTERWFVVPGAGGFELEAAGGAIRTVTPVAPLGRALLGLEIGDEGTLATPRGARTFEVVGLE